MAWKKVFKNNRCIFSKVEENFKFLRCYENSQIKGGGEMDNVNVK